MKNGCRVSQEPVLAVGLIIVCLLASGCAGTISTVKPANSKAAAKLWPVNEQEADSVIYSALSTVIEGKPILRVAGPDLAYQASWRFMSDHHDFTAIAYPAKGKTTNNNEVVGYAFEVRHSGSYLDGPSAASRVMKAIVKEADSITPANEVSGVTRIRTGYGRRVVTANRTNGFAVASGTGFFVTTNGYFVTCAHLVKGAGRVEIKIGNETFGAVIVRNDEPNDIAILKSDGMFRALPLAISRGVKLGEKVRTIGFPNPDLQGVEPKLTSGEINSLAGLRDDPRYFQVSMAVQPGNSGGALVGSAGLTIGVVTSTLNPMAALRTTGNLPQSVNYAVKSAYVMTLLESIPEFQGGWAQVTPAVVAEEGIIENMRDATGLVLVY